MGWERRANGQYFYRKVRCGRHVTSEYVGAGAEAQRIAELDNLTRIERSDARAERLAEREIERAIDIQLDDVIGRVQGLVSEVLVTCGYHNHRGQWRKRRHGNISEPETTE